MGKVINDDDNGYVDPDGTTVKIDRGRKSSAMDDAPDATKRASLRERIAEEDETTRRFRKRSVESADEPADEPDVLPAGWLVIVKGAGLGHVATLETGVNILGRAPESQVPLDFGDRQITRDDHARISYNRKTRQFRILPGKGSETWLKEELVDEARPLVRGDLVTVGSTVLRFMPFCDDGFDWSDDEGQ